MPTSIEIVVFSYIYTSFLCKDVHNLFLLWKFNVIKSPTKKNTAKSVNGCMCVLTTSKV